MEATHATASVGPSLQNFFLFRSKDQSIGIVVIAWRGPGFMDKFNSAVIAILLKYLADDVSYQHRSR